MVLRITRDISDKVAEITNYGKGDTKECIFCEMPEREARRKIRKDDTTTTILAKYPIQKGHLLIIPQNHYKDILTAPRNVALNIFNTSRELGMQTQKILNPPGMVMGANIGAAAGIEHLHYHVSPIFTLADPSLHGRKEEISEPTVQEMLKLFKEGQATDAEYRQGLKSALRSNETKECILCTLPEKEIAKTVYEDKTSRVIEPNSPVGVGYLIVLPKDHYSNTLTAPYEQSLRTFEVMREVATETQKQLNCIGMVIGTNIGIAATVQHLHYHIFPMYSREYPKLQKNEESNLNRAAVHEMTELLRY